MNHNENELEFLHYIDIRRRRGDNIAFQGDAKRPGRPPFCAWTRPGAEPVERAQAPKFSLPAQSEKNGEKAKKVRVARARGVWYAEKHGNDDER